MAEILNKIIEEAKASIEYVSKPNKYGIAVFRRYDPSAKTWSSAWQHGLRNKITKKTVVEGGWESFHSDKKDQYFLAHKRNRYAVFSPKGVQLTKALYPRIRELPGTKYLIVDLLVKGSSQGGYYGKYTHGVIDSTNGKIVLPIEYNAATWDTKTRILRLEKNGQPDELYDSKMKPVNPTNIKWEEQEHIVKTLYKVTKSKKQGVWDKKTDKLILPIAYDKIDYSAPWAGSKIRPALFEIEDSTGSGVADMSGNIIVPTKYDDIYIEDRWISVELNGLHGMLGLDGSVKIPVRYKWVDDERVKGVDYAVVEDKNDKYGLIRISDGKIILPPFFKSLDVADSGIEVAFKSTYGSNVRTYLFDFNGHPKEGSSHNLIKDIFRHIK